MSLLINPYAFGDAAPDPGPGDYADVIDALSPTYFWPLQGDLLASHGAVNLTDASTPAVAYVGGPDADSGDEGANSDLLALRGAGINCNANTTGYSFGGWFKFDSFASGEAVMSNWALSSGAMLYMQSGTQFRLYRNGSTYTFTHGLSTGVWYHLMVTWSGFTNEVLYYVNGVLTETWTGVASPGAATVFGIGHYNNTNSTRADMAAAWVGWWVNVTLTAGQVADLAAGATAVTPPTTEEIAEDSLDAAYRVFTSTSMTTATDHDSLAYQARMAAMLHNAGHPSVTDTTVEDALDDLWAARYTSGTGQPGFGLDHTFDAFADGTTNPATTIYTYTTAMAALAFLDGYVVLTGAAATAQKDRAEDLAAMMLTDCWGYVSGSWMGVWYSDRPADHGAASFVVLNVNALTLAAIARLDRYNGTAFDATKRAGIEALIEAQEGVGAVPGRWLYRLSTSGANDLTHHAYMVEGAAEAVMVELADAMAYMWDEFFDGNGTIDTGRFAVMGSTAWGPGEGLSALCLSPAYQDEAQVLAASIASSIDGAGVSSYANSTARSRARYGLGTARFAAQVLGDGSLFP